jgi:hypothetical protein
VGSRLASHPSFCSEAKSRAALGYERRARPVVRRAGALHGEGTRPPLSLLYVAPKLSTSAIGAYPHDV